MDDWVQVPNKQIQVPQNWTQVDEERDREKETIRKGEIGQVKGQVGRLMCIDGNIVTNKQDERVEENARNSVTE